MAVIAKELPLVRSTSTFTRLPYAPVDIHSPDMRETGLQPDRRARHRQQGPQDPLLPLL